MEQRIKYTYVTVMPAMYDDIVKVISTKFPKKIYLDFDKDFYVINVRTEDEEYNKNRFSE